ncbi:MAG: hypothetical protein IJF43_02160 [Firmicutes bacterium]|nr:hypothetical protein [Bacillota bacterium]MBQ9963883.1 hypothetical protein [Clostridia bacterium]
MQEQQPIKKASYSKKKIFIILLLLGVVLAIIMSFITAAFAMREYVYSYGAGHKHDELCYSYEYQSDFYSDQLNGGLVKYKMDCPQVVYGNAFSYAIANAKFVEILIPFILISQTIAMAIFISTKRVEEKPKENPKEKKSKNFDDITNVLD